MASCKDIQTQMMDWLYGELDPSQRASFEEHVSGCAACGAELDSLVCTREAFRELPDEEPPASATAILMHEAARRGPSRSAAAGGVWAWFQNLMRPIVMHPAAVAMATLVLVATVGGTMYVRGKDPLEASRPGVRGDSAAVELSRAGAAPAEEVAVAQRVPAPADEPSAPDLAPDPREVAQGVVSGGVEGDDRVAPGGKVESKGGGGVDRDTILAEPSRVEPSLKKLDSKSGVRASKRSASSGASGLAAAEGMADADDRESEVRADRASGRMAPGDSRDGRGAGSGAGASFSRSKDGLWAGDDLPSSAQAAPMSDTLASGPARAEPTPRPSATSAAPAQAPSPSKADKSKAGDAWAETQHGVLLKALGAGKCDDAARIANDIHDRAPDYYRQSVGGSGELKRCSEKIAHERSRREGARSKAKKAADKADAAGATE